MAKFQKGKSGNPNGRPPNERSLANAIKAMGETLDPTGTPYKLRLAEMLWKRALNDRDMNAAKLILEYTDGKPPQQVNADVTTGGESLNRSVDYSTLTDDELRAIIASRRRRRTGKPDAGET